MSANSNRIRQSISACALFSILLSGSISPAYSEESAFEAISQLEQKEFGATKSDQPIPARLDALEQKVFGKSQSGGLWVRIEGLKKAEAAAKQNAAKPASARIATAAVSKGLLLPASAGGSQSLKSLRGEVSRGAGLDLPMVLQTPQLQTQARPKTAGASSAPYTAARTPGQPQVTGKIETDALRKYPANPTGYFRMAMAAEERGDLATALQYYVMAFNNEPSNELYKKGLSDVEAKIKAEVPLYHSDSYYFPSERDPRFLINYGVRLYSMGCFKQAEELFNTAAWMDPYNPSPYFDLAVMAERGGQLTRARTLYQRAQRLFNLYADDYEPYSVHRPHRLGIYEPGASLASEAAQEDRKFLGKEDPKNARDLVSEALMEVGQDTGGPVTVRDPNIPVLNVGEDPPGYFTVGTRRRNIDTCDRCLILRNVTIGPN